MKTTKTKDNSFIQSNKPATKQEFLPKLLMKFSKENSAAADISEEPTKKLFGLKMKAKEGHLFESRQTIFPTSIQFWKDLVCLETMQFINFAKKKDQVICMIPRGKIIPLCGDHLR